MWINCSPQTKQNQKNIPFEINFLIFNTLKQISIKKEVSKRKLKALPNFAKN